MSAGDLIQDSEWLNMAPEDREKRFADQLEFMQPLIQNRRIYIKDPFLSLVPRGPYDLFNGNGANKKIKRFHPGVTEQIGLGNFDYIQVSSDATESDEGFDACSFNPYLVQFGMQTILYRGMFTERATKWLCARDYRHMWEAAQQVALQMSFLADYTLQMQALFARESTSSFANLSNKVYILTDGAPDTIIGTYNNLTVDADGDYLVTFNQSAERMSTMSWDHLEWITARLQLLAPQSSIGMNDVGAPIYPWIGDLKDFQKMIRSDNELREDYRFASPMVNIESYGMIRTFRNFALMDFYMTPRFTVKTKTSGQTVLKQVKPYLDNVAVDPNMGTRVTENPEYLNAEFGGFWILPREFMMIETPPSGPATLGSGTEFGTDPGTDGEFIWNRANSEDNPFGDKGRYVCRLEQYPKPLEYDDEAVLVIYRRCPNIQAKVCEIGGDDALSSPVASVGIGAANVAYVTGSTTLVEIALAGIPDIEPLKQVSISVDGGGGLTAWLVGTAAAPRCVFSLSAADAATVVGASSSISVSWT